MSRDKGDLRERKAKSLMATFTRLNAVDQNRFIAAAAKHIAQVRRLWFCGQRFIYQPMLTSSESKLAPDTQGFRMSSYVHELYPSQWLPSRQMIDLGQRISISLSSAIDRRPHLDDRKEEVMEVFERRSIDVLRSVGRALDVRRELDAMFHSPLTTTRGERYGDFGLERKRARNFDISPLTFDMICGSDDDPQPQLPRTTLNANSVVEGRSCGICLETYFAGQDVSFLPCTHVFHSDCIQQWASKNKCPLCRAKIDEEIVDHDNGQSSLPLDAALAEMESATHTYWTPRAMASSGEMSGIASGIIIPETIRLGSPFMDDASTEDSDLFPDQISGSICPICQSDHSIGNNDVS